MEFQSEKVKIHKVHAKISELYRGILKNFIDKKYLDETPLEKVNWYNPTNFSPENEIYLGAKFEQEAESFCLNPRKLSEIKTSCLNLYVALAKNIQTRFDFGGGILTFMTNFKPSVVLNLVTTLNMDIELVNT